MMQPRFLQKAARPRVLTPNYSSPSSHHIQPAATTRLFSVGQSSQESSDQTNSAYENALVEVESAELYGLSCKQSDLSYFASKLEAGDLNLFPEYQRKYVWKPAKASRLLATILCNRFMPPIVFHEKKKGQFDVVDGKQRLTSALGFLLNRDGAPQPKIPLVRDQLATILPDLKSLKGLDESYSQLNGLSFDKLTSDRQKAYKSYTISYMVIPYGTPKTDVFEVYEDINSGGEDLTPHQVRRAVYHGPYIKMIDDLARSCDDFHAIRDPKAYKAKVYEHCPKETDSELILRAIAFRRNGDKYRTPMKKFLNRELEGTDDFESRDTNHQRRMTDMVDELRTECERVLRVAREVFGARAFRKTKDNISKTMWDAKYCAIAELLTVYKDVDFVKSKDAMARSLEDSIQRGFFSRDNEITSAPNFVKRRDELKKLMSDAILKVQGTRDGRRAFPSTMKQDLFNLQAGKCAICGQSIEADRLEEANYVHIDHIIPHSKGGRTEADNAQLTHKLCNLEKSAGPKK